MLGVDVLRVRKIIKTPTPTYSMVVGPAWRVGGVKQTGGELHYKWEERTRDKLRIPNAK